MKSPASLTALFWIFFRIACTSFGGFMAMIAIVENVVVRQKKWMTHEEMLDGISLASLLPGPVAVNVVVYTGYRLRGGLGALVSALGAILPSFTLIVILAVTYFRWGQMPMVSKLFMGFIPAMSAIILVTAWNMGRKTIRDDLEAALAVVAAITLLWIGGFYSTLGIILGAGALGWLLFRHETMAEIKDAGGSKKKRKSKTLRSNANLVLLTTMPAVTPLIGFDPSLLAKVFVVFAGMSVMLFGGGYVFIPLMQEIVVGTQKWVTQREFVDAIAMGQITPGPILVSAAFIGLKVAGLAGAVAATAGIYLPPAILMMIGTRFFAVLKQLVAVNAALRGIRPAVIGMIAAAAWIIGSTAVPNLISAGIFIAAAVGLLHFRIDLVWIIPAAGIAGLLFY